jgi:hypothetical protein
LNNFGVTVFQEFQTIDPTSQEDKTASENLASSSMTAEWATVKALHQPLQ